MQITAEVMPDDELEVMFDAVDVDLNGVVTVDELTAFIWGPESINDAEAEAEADSGVEGGENAAGVPSPELEPEPEPGPRVEIPEYQGGANDAAAAAQRKSPPSSSSAAAAKKLKKKKSSEHLPWEDSKLAERNDAKRKVQALAVLKLPPGVRGGGGPRLPPKMRPIHASIAHTSPSPTTQRGGGGGGNEGADATAAGTAGAAAAAAARASNGRRRERAKRVSKPPPRSTVYHLEKEPHDYWGQVKQQRQRRAAAAVAANGGPFYAESEASFETVDDPAATGSTGTAATAGVNGSGGGGGGDTSLSWQSPSGVTDKWHLGTSSLFPVKKRHFLRHLYIKCIILPSQARDRHRKEC